MAQTITFWLPFKKTLAFVSASLAAIVLGLAWDSLVSTPAVISFQAGLVEQLPTVGALLGLVLSFLVGVSMIVVPCTFPMVFALSPIAEEAKSRRGWLTTIGLFTLGLVGSMAAVGVIVALVGASLLNLFAEERARLTLTVLLYSAIGLFALAYALNEFGWLHLPGLPLVQLPGWARTLGRYPRSILLGLVVGGGLGVGCPAPTYYAVLLWDAAIGNPLYGAALLGINALGRVTPIFIIGSLFFAGAKPGSISRWITERRATVKLINGIALTLLGGFLIVYWGLVVGLKALV
ncbi:MAG: sulfite exporter TauE/SafE family protein [Chloroflexi bacterium]|nr:sulfite exporter TauE/SafE family protein [Chloroflexota bacterium]